MKILCGVGAAFRLALTCLLIGFALGFYFGTEGNRTPPNGSVSVGSTHRWLVEVGSSAAMVRPCSWNRTGGWTPWSTSNAALG
jgi:hypothetical protein